MQHLSRLMLLALSFSFTPLLFASEPMKVPMTSSQWQVVAARTSDPKTDVQFVRKEGFPQGVLVLKAGSVALNGLDFRNGTIDFDLKPLSVDIPGISFRRDAQGNAEEFYIRSFPDCRAEDDCIQYAPVINGFMLWNGYPQYQTSAAVLDGWNHVKLVVSGHRMKAFLNYASAPCLVVGSMQAETTSGSIELRGPAFFANLTITPDAVENLSPAAVPDPAARDKTILRQWELAPLTPLHFGKTPNYSDMPGDASAWRKITADPSGLVNLNRQFHASEDPPSLVWLRSDVDSNQEQSKVVSMGWIGQAWIFVNGALITQGKNFYYPDAERRDPDGRLSFENGSFAIPLREGHNTIVVALYSSVRDVDGPRTAYTWGMELKLHDTKGITMPAPRTAGPPAKE